MSIDLQARADELAGRPVEVEQTKDGKYIVLFMQFSQPPPPKGDTPEEALTGFIKKMEAYRQTEEALIAEALDKAEAILESEKTLIATMKLPTTVPPAE